MSSDATVTDFKALAKQAGMQSAVHFMGDTGILNESANDLSTAHSTGEAWQLPERQLLECICQGRSVGGQSILECLLGADWQTGVFKAFVDAAQSLDPTSLSTGLEKSLLWVQVKDLQQLVKALDLLLRDDNFALVAADLRGLPLQQIQSIQPFVWYRLQRLSHQRSGGFVVFTDQPIIRCADKRIILSHRRCLDDLDTSRAALLQRIQASSRLHGRNQIPDTLEAQAG